LQYFSL